MYEDLERLAGRGSTGKADDGKAHAEDDGMRDAQGRGGQPVCCNGPRGGFHPINLFCYLVRRLGLKPRSDVKTRTISGEQLPRESGAQRGRNRSTGLQRNDGESSSCAMKTPHTGKSVPSRPELFRSYAHTAGEVTPWMVLGRLCSSSGPWPQEP